MKYVIDSSVAFKWVVPEILSDKAQLLRDDFRNAVHELIAPDIFTSEIAHEDGQDYFGLSPSGSITSPPLRVTMARKVF